MKRNAFKTALCAVAAILILTGIVSAAKQEALSKSLIRLHIVGASDSEEDQGVKLAVRDAVMEKYGSAFGKIGDVEEGEAFLTENLSDIEELANDTLEAEGSDDRARAYIEDAYFPTRVYDTFTLPPGRYRALKIDIGEAGGKNWWCVLFPPLCMGAAESIEDSGLTDGEIAVITTDSETIRLKFKAVELYYKACALFE